MQNSDIELSVPRESGDGVWSLPVPFPHNPMRYTLVYVIASDAGPVLVDTGWDDPDAWRGLVDGLATIGWRPSDVVGAVITHHHPDHSGLVERLRAAGDAWIAMHGRDARALEQLRTLRADLDDMQAGLLRRAGASEEEIGEQRDGFAKMTIPGAPDRELADGEAVDVPGRKLRVLWTPGHTPGHICLHLEGDGDDGRLFTGDHLLAGITPHVGLYPYDEPDTDPLADFLDSLARLADLEIDEALPAHGHAVDGVVARAQQILAHHHERLDEVAGLLSQRPSTLWEITGAMHWKRPWEQMRATGRRMAAGEAAAHLRTLERRGVCRRLDGEALRYVVAT